MGNSTQSGPKGRLTGFILAGVFVILAVVAMLQAVSSIALKRNPQLAARLWPSNGMALADISEDLLAAAVRSRGDGTLPDGALPEVESFARQALTLEPTMHQAVRAAAQSRLAAGDVEAGTALMRLAGTMTKRDRIANLWIAEDAARNNDVATSLDYLDLTLRSSRAYDAAIFPLLVGTLQNNQALEAFVNLLSRRPPWTRQFWAAAVREDSAMANAARLRSRLAEDGIAGEVAIDAALMNGLVKQGAYEQAAELFATYAKPSEQSANVLFNSGFDALPQLPPFDWQVISEGDFGAELLAADGVMLVTALPDAGNVVARQIVRLAPGEYELAATMQQAPLATTDLQLRVSCARGSRSGARLAELDLNGTSSQMRFQHGLNACDFAWVELMMAVPPSGTVDEVFLDTVVLRSVAS